MKKTLLLIIAFIISLSVDVQGEYNTFNIRNYNRSLAVAINQNQTAKLISDEFGKVISISNPANANLKYLYHGQEYDKQLGLYFYPSRIYSALSGRFFQTDPMSQYASPYSFLGGDPVNQIDETGNAGKPLILHNSDYLMPDGKEIWLHDMQSQIKDAYYVPLADFLNGEIADLPEFNGNVFINSHMGAESGGAIRTESGGKMTKFKTPKLKKVNRITGKNEYAARVEGKELGRELRDFSDTRNLEIKSILVGGCEGETAAKEIGSGFTERASGLTGRRSITTAGLKRDRLSLIMGEKTIEEKGINGLKGELRYHVRKNGIPNGADIFEDVTPPQFDCLVHYPNGLSNEKEEIPYANKAETRDMVVNGRVPASLESDFSSYKFQY